MKRFVAGLALGIALTALAGVAYASIPDGGGVIHTCYKENNWRPIDFPTEHCRPHETALTLNQNGLQGPQGAQGAPGPKGAKGNPGSFSGTLTSPNGQYSISVTDSGVVLSGNGSSINLSGANVSIASAGAVSVVGAGTARLGGAQTVLCPSGSGTPVGRIGDQVDPVGSPFGFIASGSPTVSAC